MNDVWKPFKLYSPAWIHTGLWNSQPSGVRIERNLRSHSGILGFSSKGNYFNSEWVWRRQKNEYRGHTDIPRPRSHPSGNMGLNWPPSDFDVTSNTVWNDVCELFGNYLKWFTNNSKGKHRQKLLLKYLLPIFSSFFSLYNKPCLNYWIDSIES